MSTNATRKLSLSALLLLVFLLGIYTGNSSVFFSERTTTERNDFTALSSGEIFLIIENGTDSLQSYTLSIESGESLREILNRAAQQNNFQAQFRDYGPQIGTVLESINHVGPSFENNQDHWQYWINGKYRAENPNEITVYPGDEVLVRFTRQQPLNKSKVEEQNVNL